MRRYTGHQRLILIYQTLLIIKRKESYYGYNNERYNWGGGTTFSASPATVSVPTGYLVDEKNTYTNDITRTITIPNGVHVIEVYAYANGEHEMEYPLFMTVSSNNKQWYHGSNGGDGPVAFQGYIGVTQNKQYSVRVYAGVRGGDSYIDRFYIRYSPEINKQTPDIYDY